MEWCGAGTECLGLWHATLFNLLLRIFQQPDIHIHIHILIPSKALLLVLLSPKSQQAALEQANMKCERRVCVRGLSIISCRESGK